MRVFLVEDSELLRTRLEALLASVPGATSAGHASGAKEAVRTILAVRPDAVVLDIHLKEGNGFDVLRALQQSAPEVRVFVLTNYPTDAHRRKAAELGARGFFDKSHDIDALRAALASR